MAKTTSSRLVRSRGRKSSRSIPGGIELGLEAHLGQPLTVPAGDRDVAKLLAIAGEDAVLRRRIARVVRRLDVLDEVDGMPRVTEPRQTGRAVSHQVAIFSASSFASAAVRSS